MKKFSFLVTASVCAAFLLSSCNTDKKNNTPDVPDDPTPDVPVDVIVPDVIFESFYVGDYNDAGTGNLILNISEGKVDENEDQTAFIGNGQIVCLDLNITLPSTVAEADKLHLEAGTYTVADDTYAAGTWNVGESYVVKVEDDKVIYSQVNFTDGTVVIEKTQSGAKVTVEGTLDGGDKFSYVAEGVDRVCSHASDSKFSNLDTDIKLANPIKASCSSLGDIVGDDKTQTVVLVLADKYYDFESDFGNGESLMFYINVAPGDLTVPVGKFTKTLNLDETEELEVNTMVAGFYMWGSYAGNWYMCPAYGYEAALTAGELEVVKNEVEEGAAQSYTITGDLTDAYGKHVTFSYSGEVVMMEYED